MERGYLALVSDTYMQTYKHTYIHILEWKEKVSITS